MKGKEVHIIPLYELKSHTITLRKYTVSSTYCCTHLRCSYVAAVDERGVNLVQGCVLLVCTCFVVRVEMSCSER